MAHVNDKMCLGTAEKHGRLKEGLWYFMSGGRACRILSCTRQDDGYHFSAKIELPGGEIQRLRLSHMNRVWREDDPAVEFAHLDEGDWLALWAGG